MESTKAKSKWKSRLTTLLFILINVGVILWTALREYRDGADAASFKDVEIRYRLLIPAALCFLLSIGAETLKYVLIMRSLCGRSDWHVARRTVLLGKYYDYITPFGLGGQPFQIYYMNQCGYPAAQSAAVPLAGFLTMQFGFMIVAPLCFVFGGSLEGLDAIRITRYVGIILFSLPPLAILLFAYLPKTSGHILAWCVKILGKLHLVRAREALEEKTHSTVAEYSACVRMLVSRGWLFLELLLLSVLYQVAILSIPYFVVRAFGGEIGYWASLVTTASIQASITFIPTPGNAGAAEGSFYLVFSMLTTGYTFWAMLSWRFFVYYIFLLFGIVIHVERYFARRKGRETPSAKI